MAALIMADDHLNELFRTLGRVEEKVDQATAQNAEIKSHLRQQDEDSAANRDLAIQAREAKDAKDEARFQTLDEKATKTGGRVSAIEKMLAEEVRPVLVWHRDEGSKLGGRVSILEQERVAAAAAKIQADKLAERREGERRGIKLAWGLVISALTMLAVFLGWLGIDRLSSALFRLAVMLGAHG